MTQEELWNWMMEGNYPEGWPKTPSRNRVGTATLKVDVMMYKWEGHGKPESRYLVKAGSKVKINMASRMGDVGITDDLAAPNGYNLRIQCVPAESEILGQIEPDDVLDNIEVEDKGPRW